MEGPERINLASVIRRGAPIFLERMGEMCRQLCFQVYESSPIKCDGRFNSSGVFFEDGTSAKTAITHGMAARAFSPALVCYDSCRGVRLPANLLQAQRDSFGALIYEWVDKAAREFFRVDGAHALILMTNYG